MIETFLSIAQPVLGEEEIEAVTRVLRSGQLAQGPEVAALEEEFAENCGVRHAVTVNSGTAALHCALEGLGVGEGDEVLVTPLSYVASVTPVLMQRAIPRFVDIDERTFNVDIESFAKHVTPRTKAVIGVDLYGLPFGTQGAQRLRDKGVAVIEDTCQAIGADRAGALTGSLRDGEGSFGDAACFSLYATKNITAGEGGVLTTNSDALAASARRFRWHGQGERYEYLSLGFNYRMTDIAAAIARVQLRRLEERTKTRERNASVYNRLLAEIPGITTPSVPNGLRHAYHHYTIIIDSSATKSGIDRDGLREVLRDAGIGCDVYYPEPLHLVPVLKEFGFQPGDCPVAERLVKQVVSLPVHPSLQERDIELICKTITDCA